MSFDPHKCGGLDPTLGYVSGSPTSAQTVTAHTSNGGNGYDPEDPGFSPFIGVATTNHYDCSGPKGSVTCNAAIGGDAFYEWDTNPIWADSTGAVRLQDLAASGDADFYALVTILVTLQSTVAPAIGCDPGGPGLFDPGPSCVVDSMPIIGTGPDDVHVNFIAGPATSTQISDSALQVTLARSDDPSLWPYQNPFAGLGPDYAEQGSWMFTAAEIQHLTLELKNSGDFAAFEFAAEIHMTPMKWQYGYGPVTAGAFMCVL